MMIAQWGLPCQLRSPPPPSARTSSLA
uniref:Uncharacterized protein n=1 Tax=Anguilla anguilla TaxID=7936 RepID=A0A0E9U301_ANGAN